MRWTWGIAVLLVLALAPVAIAQEDEDVEPEPTTTVVPVDGCDRGPGTDADYAYCGDPSCEDADQVYGAGADADYVYGCPTSDGVPLPSTPGGGAIPRARPIAAATLPLTGGEAPLLALLGAGFLLVGTGLRLRTASG